MMSPCSQPPGQGCGFWEWALNQVPHSGPVVHLRKETDVGGLDESGTGRTRSV